MIQAPSNLKPPSSGLAFMVPERATQAAKGGKQLIDLSGWGTYEPQ